MIEEKLNKLFIKARARENTDIDSAIQLYEALIASQPSFWKCMFRLAFLHFKLHRYSLVDEYLNLAINIVFKSDFTIIPNWNPKSLLENATPSYNEENEAFPLNNQELTRLIDYYTTKRDNNEILSYLFIQRSVSPYKNGDYHYKERLSDCTNGIQLSKNKFLAYFARAHTNHCWCFENDAIKDLKKCLELNPGFSLAYYELGLLKVRSVEKSIIYFSRVIELMPNFYLPYVNRSYLFGMKLQQFQSALNDIDKAIELTPQGKLYKYRGKLHLKYENYSKALSNFNLSIDIDPTDSWNYYYRGNSNYLLGNFQEAIKDYTIAISLSSGNFVDAYVNRGHSKVKVGNFHGAIEDYQKNENDYFRAKKALNELMKYINDLRTENYPNLKLL